MPLPFRSPNLNAEQDIQRIRGYRSADFWNDPDSMWRSNINTLPDPAWDAVFGALDRVGEMHSRQGKKVRINTSSLGRLKMRDEITGKLYDPSRGEIAPGLDTRSPAYKRLDPTKYSAVALEGLRRAQGY